MPRDGNRPVLLTGYGGFNISLTPAFDPANFVLLEKGGICAVANLRGGGEYGEAWHEAGMFERKQNVFDDFSAAAEWLASSGYSNPKRIAIEGGSNGGLLTAAVMVQRPDLFGAVVCRVPVADMLRYHLFTVGRFWISSTARQTIRRSFPFLYKVLAATQRDRRRAIPANPDYDCGYRRPRVPRHGEEVRRTAASLRPRRSGAHSGGNEGRTWRRQTTLKDDRRGRRHFRVPVRDPRCYLSCVPGSGVRDPGFAISRFAVRSCVSYLRLVPTNALLGGSSPGRSPAVNMTPTIDMPVMARGNQIAIITSCCVH